MPIVEDLMNALDDYDGKDDIIIDMKANLVSLFLIHFYSQYYKSDFYDKMIKNYLVGHVPCGWCGEYPESKFRVY